VDTVSALAVFVLVFNPYMPMPNAIKDNAKPAVPRINLFFLFMFYFSSPYFLFFIKTPLTFLRTSGAYSFLIL
jgi:hypothetical protein